MQLEKDSKSYPGINLLHYKNPETGINDVTMIIFDLRLFQKEMATMSPTLSDAITQLGIIQRPLPSAGQSMNPLPQEVTNHVINQEGLPQTEQAVFTQ